MDHKEWEKIKQTFENRFAAWDLLLPAEKLFTPSRGAISGGGGGFISAV